MKSNGSERKEVPPELDGRHLEAVVRELFQLSWSTSRRWIELGKVHVDGELVVDRRCCVRRGAEVCLTLDAPRLREPQTIDERNVVYIDRHLVVVSKPPRLSTVNFAEGERGALVDLLRKFLNRRSRSKNEGPARLMVVQRLDRGTSGLLVFARTHLAFVRLGDQLREHSVLRRYVALAHGHVETATITSHLLDDRGDGLRGSRERSPRPKLRHSKKGKLAITHVTSVKCYEKPLMSLIRCRLETGRTNQIRIHLSESGHPLLGETVYLRDYTGPVLEAPRLMLHAGELGFVHPITGEQLHFEQPMPTDMSDVLSRAR